MQEQPGVIVRVTRDIDAFMLSETIPFPGDTIDERFQQAVASARADLAIRLAALPRPVRILDVGGEQGDLYDFLATHVFDNPEHFIYVGFGSDDRARKDAHPLEKRFSNVTFQTGSIHNLRKQFAWGDFDVVVCHNVINHSPYFERCMVEMCGVASRHVHVNLMVSDAPACLKYRATDLASGKHTDSLQRVVSTREIDDVAVKSQAIAEILAPAESADGFSTVIFHKGKIDKLDFGCGPSAKPGFAGVDIRPEKGVRFCCQAWEIVRHVPPVSISEIYSRHFFEHLSFPQGKMTLEAWVKILKHGGILQIVLPDMRFHIDQFLDPDQDKPSPANPHWTTRQHAIAGLWGWQREADTQMWDIHKSGYDFDLLHATLDAHGFQNIERQEDTAWNLNVKCVKH